MTTGKGSKFKGISFLFRRVFGIFFPIFYSFLILLLVNIFFSQQQNIAISAKKKAWSEKAQLLLASIKSNHKLSHLIRNAGNNLALKMEKSYSGTFDEDFFRSSFEKEFGNSLVKIIEYKWAFSYSHERASTLAIPGFEQNKKRVMERIFEALNSFSGKESLSSGEISNNSKFMKGVLGPWCAPLILGRSREGDVTPIKFDNKNYYIYWRKYSSEEGTFAGILLFLPESAFSDNEVAMQSISEEIFQNSHRRMATAFVPADEFKNERKVILPKDFYKDPRQSKQFQELLSQVKQFPSSPNAQLQFIKDFVFIRSMFSVDHIYDTVIFAPVPKGFSPLPFPFAKLSLLILVFWCVVYSFFYKKTKRIGLPLSVSFRMLFFLSGLLPVLIMLIIGSSLIEETFQAEILDLRQKNMEKLSMMDEKSDSLMPLFSLHLSEILRDKNLQQAFKISKANQLQSVYDEIRKRLLAIELDLSYLFAFAPGEQCSTYNFDKRKRNEAKILGDLMSTSVYELNIDFNEFSSQAPIVLNSAQKNWYDALKDLGDRFLRTLFLNALEHENSLSFGDEGNSFFYSTIISQNGKILKYLMFYANPEAMFRRFLKRELDAVNLNSATVFLAAEELKNSDFSLFPLKKMNVLNSVAGKEAFNFLKKCRGSLFPKSLTNDECIFIYYPISKMRSYALGSIIFLSEANQSREKKNLFLFSLAILMICAMYILASMTSVHILDPLRKIGITLEKIGKGNLETHLETERKDEIGILVNTIQRMLKGFKKRIALGKFVSGTLEKSIKQLSDATQVSKPAIITGTVLFSDIRNFTSISEMHDPAKVASMLNHHLDSMSKEIQAFNGQVEQFIGDAIVAVFRDENNGSDSMKLAVQAAVCIRKRHQQIISERTHTNGFPYEIGIGLEHGELTTGTLTSSTRSEFIIMGETRTKAEEFESRSKDGLYSKIITSDKFLKLIEDKLSFELSFVELPGEKEYEIKF